MNRFWRQLIILVIIVILTTSVRAELVVNEVLANEPGGTTTLEWVELYNNSGSHVELALYSLLVTDSSGTDTLPLTGSIPAQDYLVLCRNLLRFEEYWGNNTGEWGDTLPGDTTTIENYPAMELPLRLSNDSGRVELYRVQTPYSSLAWFEPGTGGYSWERFHPESDDIQQSIAPTGSTPGRMNSITPLPADLALETVTPWLDNGYTNIAFRIANRGLSPTTGGILELYYYDVNDPDSLGTLIAGEAIGEVDSGGAVILIGQYLLPDYYQQLVAQILLISDERIENNRVTFTAPGADFPPLQLSEFLANPSPAGSSEWVELHNTSDLWFDLDGWQLGDSIGLATVATGELLIGPTEYIVLAQDSSVFRTSYPTFSGTLHEPPTWRGLNNSSDSVRVVDVYGFVVDQTYYVSIWEDNHSWAVVEGGDQAGQWGRSEDAGGTPGGPNRVRLTPSGSETLNIDISPRIISPDGDGIDDSTLISITSSPAPSYSIKIYDAQGRLVRTLDDEVPDLRQQYVWRGESNGYERLPIGIYILYFEATGVESLKKTIVVAR